LIDTSYLRIDMIQHFPFRLPLKRHKRKTSRENSCSEEYYSKEKKSNCLRKIPKLAGFLNHHLFHLDVTKINAPIRSEGLSKQTIMLGSILPVTIPSWATLGTDKIQQILTRDLEIFTFLAKICLRLNFFHG